MPLIVYFTTALAVGAGWGRTAAGCCCLVFGVAMAGAMNDIADLEADSMAGKGRRPLVAGRLSVPQARLFAWLMGAATMVAAMPLRQPASVLLAVCAGVGAWLYSAPPARLKSRSFLGTIDLAVAYLAVPLLLGLAQSDRPPPGWSAGLVAVGLVVCAQGVVWHKDVADEVCDAATGTITPVVRFGPERLALWSPAVVIAGGILVNLGTGRLSILTVISLAWLTAVVTLAARPHRPVRWANHARWAMAAVAASSSAALAAG